MRRAWLLSGTLPRPRLAVGQHQRGVMHLRPAQPHDLASPASGQKQEPDHVGLRPGFPSLMVIERPVKAGDFLARQEPGEPGPGIVLDVPRRVGVEKAPRDGEIHDLAKEVEAAIGSARRGSTVCIEPAPDVHEGNAIQRFRPESWQQSIAKRVPRALFRRRLVAIEMGFLPRTLDEIPEQRGRFVGSRRTRAGRSEGKRPPTACASRRISSTVLAPTGPRDTRLERPPASRSKTKVRAPVVLTRTPRPGKRRSQTVYSRSRGRRRAMEASVSLARFLPAIAQRPNTAPTVSVASITIPSVE